MEKPQYQRLQIGVIAGEEPSIRAHAFGDISGVPYAEPAWLTPGFHSPYYTEVRQFGHNFIQMLRVCDRTIGAFSEKFVNLSTSSLLRTLWY